MARKNITDQQVIEACRQHSRDTFGPFVNQILANMTGQPLKVCDAAMLRAYDRGLIDFGVSLRTAWATEAGLALLETSHKDHFHEVRKMI